MWNVLIFSSTRGQDVSSFHPIPDFILMADVIYYDEVSKVMITILWQFYVTISSQILKYLPFRIFYEQSSIMLCKQPMPWIMMICFLSGNRQASGYSKETLFTQYIYNNVIWSTHYW